MLFGYSAGKSKVFQIELHITTETNLQTIFACNLQGMLRDKGSEQSCLVEDRKRDLLT